MDGRTKEWLRRGAILGGGLLLGGPIIYGGIRKFTSADGNFFLLRWPVIFVLIGAIFVAIRVIIWRRSSDSARSE